VQVPTLPAIAHEAHVPAHAVWQQTLCWQLLFAHWFAAVHG
jgi:hypothetical protein